MASSPKSFQTEDAAVAEAAPPLPLPRRPRSWHQITGGLEAACRSSVGPAGRPAMLLSTSTASAEPMTVTKVTSNDATHQSVCVLYVEGGPFGWIVGWVDFDL